MWVSSWSMPYLVSGPWLPEQCQAWFHLTEWTLSPIIAVGHSHSFAATTVPEHSADSSPLLSPFSSGSMQSAFWNYEYWIVGSKALARQQHDLSMFCEIYGCCLEQ